jgi:transcriptional regulator with XRE-family HTH domain
MIVGGNLVREARRRAGLTQAQLAERAGTTQSAIARLESGRTDPTFEQLQKLLRACGFSLYVALEPAEDVETDRWQARAILATPPEQRLERLAHVVTGLRKLRVDFQEAQRAG